MPTLHQHKPKHARHVAPKAPQARQGASERGYDANWQRLRRAFLAAHPLCWGCLVGGEYTTATQVDHRVRFSERPELRLDWDNLQPLCDRCHARKTAWERRKDE